MGWPRLPRRLAHQAGPSAPLRKSTGFAATIMLTATKIYDLENGPLLPLPFGENGMARISTAGAQAEGAEPRETAPLCMPGAKPPMA